MNCLRIRLNTTAIFQVNKNKNNDDDYNNNRHHKKINNYDANDNNIDTKRNHN